MMFHDVSIPLNAVPLSATMLNAILLNVIPLNYKTNDIINKVLLAGDKFMLEMHLRQLGFTCSACRPFTKNKKRIPKFKQTGDSRYFCENELDKACFQHDMAYGDFRVLKKITAANKVLRDKAFNIAKDPKYDGYQRGLASMVYKCFDKKTKGSGVTTLANKSAIKSIPQNEQLADELHKTHY